MINARILVRKGLKSDFDPTKMLPGEWAVSIDASTSNQIVWMCFAPGVCKRMGTYEDFKSMISQANGEIIEELRGEFEAILADVESAAKDVSADKEEVLVVKSEILNTYIPQIQNYVNTASTHAKNAKTSETNAKASENNAKVSETNAAASAEKAKTYASQALSTTPEGYNQMVSDVDLLKNAIIQTTDRTLYGSKEGGIKLIGIGGASEQGENPSPDNPQEIESVGDSGSLEIKAEGENLLNPTANTVSLVGVTVTNNGNGTYTVNGNATDSAFPVLQPSIDLDDFAGTQLKLIGDPTDAPRKMLYVWNETDKITVAYSGDIFVPEKGKLYKLNTHWTAISLSNVLLKPMLTTDLSATYDNFEPYRSKSITIPLSEPLRAIGEVKDEIVKRDGVWGVLRRIVNIGSYSGETITTDYMSTTGQLSNGASVNYVSTTPTFEPFTDQTPFYQLESYDTVTYISTDSEIEPTVILKFAKTEGDAVTLLNYNQTNLNRIAIAELTSAVLALNQE